MVKRTLAGIRREKGTAPHQKAALLVDDLRMVATLGTSLLDRRDRALLSLDFAAALQESELVALRVPDVRVEEEGLVLTLLRSKTNQEGRLETIAVAYGSEPPICPVRALRAWRDRCSLGSHRKAGCVSARGSNGGTRVKRRSKAVGIEPDLVAGHSLRRGLATAAARAKRARSDD